jgi:hypothetical protein
MVMVIINTVSFIVRNNFDAQAGGLHNFSGQKFIHLFGLIHGAGLPAKLCACNANDA